MNTAVEDEIIRTLGRRAEGGVDAVALRSGAVARARRIRRWRRTVACLTAVAALIGAAGIVGVLRGEHGRDKPAQQSAHLVPALPRVDVPGAIQRPDTVATDPSVIHFDVDAAALKAVELTWRSVWTQEGVSIRTADDDTYLIHFTIAQDAVVKYGYPGGRGFPLYYEYPPRADPSHGLRPDPRQPIGDRREYQQIPVADAPGPVKYLPQPVDGTRKYYRMVWTPAAGLTAALEMVAENPEDLVRTARAFRLDRSQRCAVPGIARNAPSDARFFECETVVHAPDATGAIWNHSIITFSARSGNYVDVMFGTFTFSQPFVANRTVNGRPARWFVPGNNPDAAKLEIPGEAGHQLIVSIRSWNFTEAEVQQIAQAFQFAGDPRDITTWPANPAP
jgi:hypothetical protein